MRARSTSSLLLLGLLLGACEPLDDGPPARYATVDPAPPEPVHPAATNTDDGRYASPEIAIGENKDVYDDNDPAALTDFRKTLDPYGKWVDDAKYGTVWEPSSATVGDHFVPYQTAGHWVYDDEWAWASDYSWGWAPFHYGRWVYIDGTGWAWVPGREYRGAWVEWGVDPGYAYLGWYPMAPAFLWYGGIAVGYGFYVGPAWSYCPRAYVFAPNVGAHVIAGPAVGPVASRVNGYVGATPGVGPAPASLGYTASAVPHSTPGAPGGLAQAQQFAHPSTAVAAGAQGPTAVASTGASASSSSSASSAHPSTSSGAAASGTASTSTAAHPTTSSSTSKGTASATPAKASTGFQGVGHSSGGFHGGGSHGGGHGGGGHH